MYAIAKIDLTESGRVAVPEGMPQWEAENTVVRIYPPDSARLDIPANQALSEALAATRRCRLIAQGNASNIEFFPGVNAALALHHEFYLPAEGAELVRTKEHARG